MKPLSLSDQVFLWLEKRQQPMHVGGLHLLSFPEGAGPKYITELADYMRSFEVPNDPFDKRLRMRLGQYYWDLDTQFDIEHHFQHSALPKPGRIRELLSAVSVKHSGLMDRERPMWECHLIEGIQGKRFALYYKVHHSMVDGIAAMRMTEKSYADTPDQHDLPPVWAMDRRKRRKKKGPGFDIFSTVSTIAGNASKQITSVPMLAKELSRSVTASASDPDSVSIFQAPACILNKPITGSRRFAAQSYSMERFKNVAKKLGATLNDVVLAVCGSALRNYLISQNALPNKPLVAMVPMSMRADDSDSGNQVAMILASLATHVADPADRIELIQRSIKQSKKRFGEMSLEEAVNYTALSLAPSTMHTLFGISDTLQAFNVIISNVPGPKKTLYWNGAKLEGMYPCSIPIDRIALNITLVSYVDSLEFGFTACRRTLPSMQRLLDYVENGIKELEIAADY